MIFLQATTVDPNTVINVNDSIKAVTSNLISQVKEDPNTLLQDLLQNAIDFGLKLLAAIAIYIIGAWLIKRVKIWLGKFFAKRKTETTLTTFITSLVSITLTVLLIIVTIGALGINTTSLAALLAAGGMAIGMALSGTVSNFASGLMILVFKPFKAGDFISAQGFSGTVKEVSIVNTKMVTPDNRAILTTTQPNPYVVLTWNCIWHTAPMPTSASPPSLRYSRPMPVCWIPRPRAHQIPCR